MNSISFARARFAFVLALAVCSFGACGGDDDPDVDAAPEPDARPLRGTVSLSWRIQRGGSDVECKEAGARFVVVQLIRQGEASGEADPISCLVGESMTREVDVGTYDLRFDLTDDRGDSLLAELVTRSGIEVGADSDTPIGEVVFPVP